MASERLSGLDTAFLCMERGVTPMQLGAVAIFRPDRPVHPADLVAVLAERARRMPQLARRVRPSWFPPGSARWSDAPQFRSEDHVHSHRLDGHQLNGGSYGSAEELVAELMARPLSRDRPLWELHVLSGIGAGRFALLLKLHHALGDGLAAQEIGLGLLDPVGPRNLRAAGGDGGNAAGSNGVGFGGAGGNGAGGGDRTGRAPTWMSVTAPVGWATQSVLAQPLRLARGARGMAQDTVGQAVEAVGMATSVLRSVRLPSPGSPLVTLSSGRREFATARLELQQLRQIRAHFGGTVNDVLLAVLAGALREWLGAHGHPVDGLNLRALVPVSRRARSGRAGGNQISGYLCELPMGEFDPGRRLRLIREAMERSKAAGSARGPGAIPLLADRLPPMMHRLAAPVVGQVASLLFDLLVTSVPVPGIPLRLHGAELDEVFPVAPLAPGHALGVALCSYRGTAYIGLHADREALPDVAGLAQAIAPSVAVLDRVCA